MKSPNMMKVSISLILYATLLSCIGVSTGDSEENQIDKEKIHESIIDMGIDYNDAPVPEYLKNILRQAVSDDSIANTYITSRGDPQLRGSIAKFYSRLIGRELNYSSEVITTVGATEALVSTIIALSKPGDEWILIQPFFNMFKSAIELANAVPRYAFLKTAAKTEDMTAADWGLDLYELKSLINNNTKGIIFNNPNNPLGKKYAYGELEVIAQIVTENNILIVADEVHEFTTDTNITKMASLPDMFDRTITIGSASKAFCIPGWRIGWIIGPEEMLERINYVHNNIVNFVTTAQQKAVSMVFEDEFKNFGSPESFLSQNQASIKRKRDFIVQAFRNAGMLPIVPDGGYCMLAGWPENEPYRITAGQKEDSLFKYLENYAHVHSYSAERYYGDEYKREAVYKLRFCYHKSNTTLENVAKHLLKFRNVQTHKFLFNVIQDSLSFVENVFTVNDISKACANKNN